MTAPQDYDSSIDIFWELLFREPITDKEWCTLCIKDTQPGQYSGIFLSMIDMYSGDKTCVLSALEILCILAVNALSHDSSHKYDRGIDIFWKH